MKKNRLNVADLDAMEVLSRDQLKAIFGGIGSSGSTKPYNFCDGKPACDSHGKCSGSLQCVTSGVQSCCF
jgi:hypothetical protein